MLHILPDKLRSALAVPLSTARLRYSLIEQTALTYATLKNSDGICCCANLRASVEGGIYVSR